MSIKLAFICCSSHRYKPLNKSKSNIWFSVKTEEKQSWNFCIFA